MRARSFFPLWLRELTIPYSQKVAVVVFQGYISFLAVALKETPRVAGGVTTYHKDGYALNLTDSSTHDDILPWEEEQRRINHKTSLSNQQEHL